MSGASHRIFNRQDSEPVTEHQDLKEKAPNQSPYCFYHPEQLILYFCPQKQCTLPLCNKCREIHAKESTYHKVIKFQEARKIAIKQIESKEKTIRRFNCNLETQIENYRDFLIAQIDKALAEITNKLKIHEDTGSLQALSNKISNGSIKSLIQYYSEEKGNQFQVPAYTYHIENPFTDFHKAIQKAFQSPSALLNPEQIKSQTLQISASSACQKGQIQEVNIKTESNITFEETSQPMASPKFSQRDRSKQSKRKSKGLSLFGSERGQSPKNSHIQSNRSIPIPRVGNSTELKSRDIKQWRKVINMKEYRNQSASRLIIQNNLKDKLSKNFQNSVLSPSQLRQICRNRNSAHRKQNGEAQLSNFLAHAKSEAKILHPSNRKGMQRAYPQMLNVRQFNF